MPDWAFSLLYILIIICFMLLFIYLTGNIWGLFIGLLVGHVATTLILSRLPGFWKDR